MNWFYEFNGEQKGPVTEAELDRLMSEGVVLPTTLVWRDGLPNWTPLGQVRAASPAGQFAGGAPGSTRCDSCGRYFDSADVVPIAGRNICAGCKPGVLQTLQQGGLLGALGDPSRTGPPWEDRETIGWFTSGWQTITAVLSRPSETFATMRVEGGITAPFLYNFLVAGSSLAIRAVYLSIAQALGLMNSTSFGGRQMLLAGSTTLFTIVIKVVAAFIGTGIFTFVYAAVFHVCLMMFGGARRPYETTYRVICYGGASVSTLNLIPFIGTIISWPWLAVAWIIGLSRAHETDLWRAVMAVLLPFALCCLAFVAMILMVVGMASQAFTH